MVGGWPRTSSDEGGEVMEILEVIGLISLVLMALEIGFHFGQKSNRPSPKVTVTFVAQSANRPLVVHFLLLL